MHEYAFRLPSNDCYVTATYQHHMVAQSSPFFFFFWALLVNYESSSKWIKGNRKHIFKQKRPPRNIMTKPS